MKRFLLACFLLTATCSVNFIPAAIAQMSAPPTVTLADFTTKVNQLNALIVSGDMPAAQAKWQEVHQQMMNVLATSKYSIYHAATPADKTAHESILVSQRDLYYAIWNLKTDLAANRVVMHTKLGEFGATIY